MEMQKGKIDGEEGNKEVLKQGLWGSGKGAGLKRDQEWSTHAAPGKYRPGQGLPVLFLSSWNLIPNK